MKRLFDCIVSLSILVVTAPLLLPVMVLIYLQDRHSPFYVAPRMGKGEKLFKMMKLRSMIINADRSGVDSTSASDPRITKLGAFIRRYKLDELPQLINVLRGDMSLVGPRPNVKRETDLYTAEEKKLLTVRPGITDLASIVFSDENEILKDSLDPDIDYNQRIRPWKNRLALLYIKNSGFALDLKIVYLTAVALISRQQALQGVEQILFRFGAEENVKTAARRLSPLIAFPPPGALEIVTSRGV